MTTNKIKSDNGQILTKMTWPWTNMDKLKYHKS